ncbi:MAG: hypothetical protein J6S01_08200 [Bacteroidales bacterium]|nr:hypothetical protein [Bacteroidales bacterium]
MGRIWKTAATAALAFITAAMFTAPSAYSQDIEKKKVRGAYGEWSMSPDLTGSEIMSRARHEAKEDALRKAGVGENVWSIFGMMSSSTSNTFMEAYSEMSVMAIEGKVAVSKEDGKWILSEAGNPVYTVKIDAEVTIDHTEEDKTYAISSNGISTHYNNDDKCSCTFTIDGTDSFLKVFFFNDEMAGMVFPSNARPEQKNTVFKVGETYSFPENGAIQMRKNSADPENVVILFVATKKNYPYLGENDAASILQWIYNLPANDRAIEVKQCVIY